MPSNWATRPDATNTKIALTPTISHGRASRRQPQTSNFSRHPASTTIASPPVSSTKLLVQSFLLIGKPKSPAPADGKAHQRQADEQRRPCDRFAPRRWIDEAGPVAQERGDDRRQRAQQAFGVGLFACVGPALRVHVVLAEHGAVDDADHVALGREIRLVVVRIGQPTRAAPSSRGAAPPPTRPAPRTPRCKHDQRRHEVDERDPHQHAGIAQIR